MSEEQEYLSNLGIGVVNYIEKHHSVTGAVPSDDAIVGYITKNFMALGQLELTNLKSNQLFRNSMEVRGILLNYDPDKQLRDVIELTPRQMAAASVMMNMTDRRSDEKKLRDLGISTEEWSNWMQNAAFSEYLRERAEVLVNNSIHTAHMGLLRGVNQGNTASIKLYYELTGRYDPNKEENVNIRMVIGRVLEAIQKHIRDPATLNALAIEMSQIAIESGSSPVAKSSVVPVTSTRNELM